MYMDGGSITPRFRRTSFTGRKASVSCMSNRAARLRRFYMAAIRKMACGLAQSLHNIAGFGAACQEVDQLLADADRIRALKSQLTQRLKEIKPDCAINSPEAECLPNTLSITFPGVENAGLMGMLDYRGIAVSAGSACSTGKTSLPCFESDWPIRSGCERPSGSVWA